MRQIPDGVDSMKAYMHQVQIWAEEYDRDAMAMSLEEFEALYGDAYFEAMGLEKERAVNDEKLVTTGLARISARQPEIRRRALEIQQEHGDPIQNLAELLGSIPIRDEEDILIDEPLPRLPSKVQPVKLKLKIQGKDKPALTRIKKLELACREADHVLEQVQLVFLPNSHNVRVARKAIADALGSKGEANSEY